MKLIRHSMLGAALCAALVGAPAQAGCWKDTELAAARVRQLQTMLMVATLKCGAAGIDITPTYNAFVRAKLGAITIANGEIKRHFAAADGQAQYDRFTTMLANAYSAGVTNAAACADAAQLALDASAESADLLAIAEQRVAPRALPDGACTQPRLATVVEEQAPPAAAAALASAAPTAAPPAAATTALPPEVVSAMAIIAAYAREHGASGGAAGAVAAPMVQTAAAP